MEERIYLTREEIEQRLERGLAGKILTFETIRCKLVSGKLHRLSVEVLKGELIVSFILGRERFEADLQYFVENTIIIKDGDNSRGSNRDIRRFLKGN